MRSAFLQASKESLRHHRFASLRNGGPRRDRTCAVAAPTLDSAEIRIASAAANVASAAGSPTIGRHAPVASSAASGAAWYAKIWSSELHQRDYCRLGNNQSKIYSTCSVTQNRW